MMCLAIEIMHFKNYTDWPDGAAITSVWKAKRLTPLDLKSFRMKVIPLAPNDRSAQNLICGIWEQRSLKQYVSQPRYWPINIHLGVVWYINVNKLVKDICIVTRCGTHVANTIKTHNVLENSCQSHCGTITGTCLFLLICLTQSWNMTHAQGYDSY
jgi:hypothetical protein